MYSLVRLARRSVCRKLCSFSHGNRLSSTLGNNAIDSITIDVDENGFATMVLSNPEGFNTFSDQVITRYVDVLNELHNTKDLRAVFLKSTGKFFSAGGNLKWMKNSINLSREENIGDALHLSRMLRQLNTLPCPSIALVQGPAFGGGVGLVSCCDIAVATKHSYFTLSEVKLGLIPATISPYVIERIGAPQARRYMLTAENISAERAQAIGLVHEVVEDETELDAWEQQFRKLIQKVGPRAAASTKSLIQDISGRPVTDEILQDTAERLATQRAGDEAQRGLQAFFQKAAAPWNNN